MSEIEGLVMAVEAWVVAAAENRDFRHQETGKADQEALVTITDVGQRPKL
jgi:hypothetical protein